MYILNTILTTNAGPNEVTLVPKEVTLVPKEVMLAPRRLCWSQGGYAGPKEVTLVPRTFSQVSLYIYFFTRSI